MSQELIPTRIFDQLRRAEPAEHGNSYISRLKDNELVDVLGALSHQHPSVSGSTAVGDRNTTIDRMVLDHVFETLDRARQSGSPARFQDEHPLLVDVLKAIGNSFLAQRDEEPLRASLFAQALANVTKKPGVKPTGREQQRNDWFGG